MYLGNATFSVICYINDIVAHEIYYKKVHIQIFGISTIFQENGCWNQIITCAVFLTSSTLPFWIYLVNKASSGNYAHKQYCCLWNLLQKSLCRNCWWLYYFSRKWPLKPNQCLSVASHFVVLFWMYLKNATSSESFVYKQYCSLWNFLLKSLYKDFLYFYYFSRKWRLKPIINTCPPFLTWSKVIFWKYLKSMLSCKNFVHKQYCC